MNKEQLEAIKERVGRFNQEKSSVVEAEIAIAIAEYDVPALIAEVERLQKALKNTDADLYVYKDLYNEMTDKNIELIKFLQARITKGWGKKAIDLAMIHIQEQEKDIERLRTQVGTEFFKYGELTTAYEEVAEENARLREDYEATEDLFRRTNEELGYEQEENKRLKKQHDALVKENKELDAENFRLQRFEQKAIYVIEENKRLREALEFYADEENYRNISMAKLYSNIAADNGKNALQALGDGDE